jgi:hypothetical protein
MALKTRPEFDLAEWTQAAYQMCKTRRFFRVAGVETIIGNNFFHLTRKVVRNNAISFHCDERIPKIEKRFDIFRTRAISFVDFPTHEWDLQRARTHRVRSWKSIGTAQLNTIQETDWLDEISWMNNTAFIFLSEMQPNSSTSLDLGRVTHNNWIKSQMKKKYEISEILHAIWIYLTVRLRIMMNGSLLNSLHWKSLIEWRCWKFFSQILDDH